MKALAFLILALLAMAVVIVPAIATRSRNLALLDRRLAGKLAGTAVAPRRERIVSMPEAIAPLFARAQIEPDARLALLWGASLLMAALLALLLKGPVLALLLLIGLPLAFLAYVAQRARRRTEKLIEALPHYIDSVRQMQMVGSSLPQALERALVDAPEVVRGYMAPVARRLELGAPVSETMRHLSIRLCIPEVAMLAAAIATNLRYGGSISAVLANLANILRTRIRIKREMEAATSQAKVSARILIAMPLIAMALLMMVSPGYLDFFLGDPRGHVLAIVALCLQAMGVLVLNRMMKLAF